MQFKHLLVDLQRCFRPIPVLPARVLISYIDPLNQMKNNLIIILGVADEDQPKVERLPMRNVFDKLLCAMLVFTHVHAVAQTIAEEVDPLVTYYAKHPLGWGSVRSFQPPIFPETLAKNGARVRAEVRVAISANGTVRKIESIQTDPKNAEIETSVRKSITGREFRAPLNSRCVSIETIGELQFDFEVQDGAEKVTMVFKRPPPVPAVFPKGVIINRSQLASEFQKAYPIQARRRGVEAEVDLPFAYNARTGEVLSAEATKVTSTDKLYEGDFKSVAATAMMAAKVEPRTDLEGTFKSCTKIKFALSAGK